MGKDRSSDFNYVQIIGVPWVVGKSSILSRDIIDHFSNTAMPVLMFMDIPMISNYISNGHRFIDQQC